MLPDSIDPNRAEIPAPPTTKTRVFYAVVQYDFVAEWPNELDAKVGDAISVVAHSGREWLVARPIARDCPLRLIPVSFVEVRDSITGQPIRDVDELIDRGALPEVKELKREAVNYRQPLHYAAKRWTAL